jgi:hypothetical protein
MLNYGSQSCAIVGRSTAIRLISVGTGMQTTLVFVYVGKYPSEPPSMLSTERWATQHRCSLQTHRRLAHLRPTDAERYRQRWGHRREAGRLHGRGKALNAAGSLCMDQCCHDDSVMEEARRIVAGCTVSFDCDCDDTCDLDGERWRWRGDAD